MAGRDEEVGVLRRHGLETALLRYDLMIKVCAQAGDKDKGSLGEHCYL